MQQVRSPPRRAQTRSILGCGFRQDHCFSQVDCKEPLSPFFTHIFEFRPLFLLVDREEGLILLLCDYFDPILNYRPTACVRNDLGRPLSNKTTS